VLIIAYNSLIAENAGGSKGCVVGAATKLMSKAPSAPNLDVAIFDGRRQLVGVASQILTDCQALRWSAVVRFTTSVTWVKMPFKTKGADQQKPTPFYDHLHCRYFVFGG
jgi:hypothetical protein